MTTLHDFGGVLGWPLDTFFRLSHFMVKALGLFVMWSLCWALPTSHKVDNLYLVIFLLIHLYLSGMWFGVTSKNGY